MKQGQARKVNFDSREDDRRKTFHLRCLPDDFPPFKVNSSREGGPRLTMVQMSNGYAGAFDRHGAPVWWYQVDSGSSDPVDMIARTHSSCLTAPSLTHRSTGSFGRQFPVRTLDGRLVRDLVAADGLKTDLHDLQPAAERELPPRVLTASSKGSTPDGSAVPATPPSTPPRSRRSGRTASSSGSGMRGPGSELAETGRWWKH